LGAIRNLNEEYSKLRIALPQKYHFEVITITKKSTQNNFNEIIAVPKEVMNYT